MTLNQVLNNKNFDNEFDVKVINNDIPNEFNIPDSSLEKLLSNGVKIMK